MTRPVQFTLTVNDFGVKYVGKHSAQHLIMTLKQHYKVEEDWDGAPYCGITLAWNYAERYVDISMPRYVDRLLAHFNHKPLTRPQHSPHPTPPQKFGADAQEPLNHDTLPILPPQCIKHIQQIISTIMYYARAVDLTTLVALSSITAEQAKATLLTEE